MFDFLRNLTKSEAEKDQEKLSAYLDNALTPRERTAFEEQLRSDSALQASLEQQRQIKQQISQLPRMRAPRNFTLDPALYGRPAPQRAFRLYPIVRTATALAAIMLIFLFSVELFTSVSGGLDTAANEPVASNGELAGVEDADRAFGTAEEAELAVEGEMAAEEPAEEVAEEEMEEAASEEAFEAETAVEEPAPPQEEMVEEEAELAPPAAAAEEAGAESAAASSTGEATTTLEEDGTVITKTAEPTITTDLAPTITSGQDNNFNLYSDTVEAQNRLPEAEQPIEETQPSTIRFLQIGLGILFVILLAATWLLRRQL